MASSSKKKTTMAKLNREASGAAREKRLHKQAKKNARKLEASQPPVEVDETSADDADTADDAESSREPLAQVLPGN